MSGTETRQRGEYLIACATPEEKAAVEAEADLRGISLGELVRQAALATVGAGPRPKTDRPPGCICREPGKSWHFRCPEHSPYPDVRRGLSLEAAQEIDEDSRREHAEDAADREERQA